LNGGANRNCSVVLFEDRRDIRRGGDVPDREQDVHVWRARIEHANRKSQIPPGSGINRQTLNLIRRPSDVEQGQEGGENKFHADRADAATKSPMCKDGNANPLCKEKFRTALFTS